MGRVLKHCDRVSRVLVCITYFASIDLRITVIEKAKKIRKVHGFYSSWMAKFYIVVLPTLKYHAHVLITERPARKSCSRRSRGGRRLVPVPAQN